MSRRKFPPWVVEHARQRRRDGLTREAIALELGGRGVRVSDGWLTANVIKVVDAERRGEPVERSLTASGGGIEIPATDARAAAEALAALRRGHADVADMLDRGVGIVDALQTAGLLDPLLLRSPEAMADLALASTEWPGYAGDAPRGEGERELARALELLEGALELVRRRGVAERWKRRRAS